MAFFRSFSALLNLRQLPRDQRRITFYSEGKNYWPHLKHLLQCVLSADIPVCYITADPADPVVDVQHPRLTVFVIDSDHARIWLFENIDTDIMIMTMPDLHQYQIKRSRYPVHYLYVQHSLVSLHMVYRRGAFDYFDSICCAGPHHAAEIRAMEQFYASKPKKLLSYGYPWLDEIRQSSGNHWSQDQHDHLHVLLAPSWGKEMILESGLGAKIVDHLLNLGHTVTLRPHPQTLKLTPKIVQSIVRQHQFNSCFHFESHVAGQDSLHQSDMMITDWSGVALDYAFGLSKPVNFMDVPRKINNPDYHKLGIEPLEVLIREQIGKVVDIEHCDAYQPQNIDFDALRQRYCYPLNAQLVLEHIQQILAQKSGNSN